MYGQHFSVLVDLRKHCHPSQSHETVSIPKICFCAEEDLLFRTADKADPRERNTNFYIRPCDLAALAGMTMFVEARETTTSGTHLGVSTTKDTIHHIILVPPSSTSAKKSIFNF